MAAIVILNSAAAGNISFAGTNSLDTTTLHTLSVTSSTDIEVGDHATGYGNLSVTNGALHLTTIGENQVSFNPTIHCILALKLE